MSRLAETGEFLSQFGKRKTTAIKHYRSFVEELDIATLENPGKETFGGLILGDVSFIQWVQSTFLASQKNSEIPQLKIMQPKIPIAKIVDAVCAAYKCKKETFIQKGRHRSQERGLARFLVRDLCGLSGKELGRHFDVSGAAITMRYNQSNKEIAANQKLRKLVLQVKKHILNS